MRYFVASIVSLPAVVLACGGSIGPIDPGSLHIEGSYDFTTSAFTVDTTNSCCVQPDMGHPILSQHARLDIRAANGGFTAVLTPDFGDPQTMSVSVATGDAVLTGSSASFSGGGSYATVTDSLDQIVLPIGSDGKLAGTYTATGQENVFEGDVGWQGDATASGAIGADTRAPQTKASVLSTATSVILPWDTLYVRASEPVPNLQGAVSLTTASGSVDVQWQGGSSSIVGDVSLTGYRTSWSGLPGGATLGVAAGLQDPSQNASSAVTAQLAFLDVPKASSFSGATPPAMWGATQIATGSDSCGTASSCIEIGPLDGPCTSVTTGGIAARLDVSASKTVSVTYRLRAASQYGQPYFSGIGFSVATPGSAAQSVADPNLQAQFQPTTDTTYPYATDWVTANLAVTAQSEVGLALLPFGNAAMYCGGGPAMPPMTLVVDVASISIK